MILVEGSDLVATGSDGVGAYRLKTCQFVARSAVAPGALQGRTWAAVPLAGWSAATPFAALEYWTLANDGTSVNRLDVSGALLESFTFPDVPGNTYTSFGLDYDPVHDRFYAVLAPHVGPGDYQRLSFPRPPAGASSGAPLDSLTTPIPHPCAYAPAHSGVDALGNSVYAQFDSSTNTDFRVCALSARSGEFTGLPFTWSVRAQRPNFSVLIPDDALYGLIVSDAVSVERYARKL